MCTELSALVSQRLRRISTGIRSRISTHVVRVTFSQYNCLLSIADNFALSSHSFWRTRVCGSASAEDDPLITVAESSQFKATATGEQVLGFLKHLAHEWEAAELHSIGTTVDGRVIQGIVVEPSKPDKDLRPLTVLILGGIHPGECDGKESLLAYMRDLSREKDTAWFEKMRLIFVPNFNAMVTRVEVNFIDQGKLDLWREWEFVKTHLG